MTRRRLILRKEVLTELTPDELTAIVGGVTGPSERPTCTCHGTTTNLVINQSRYNC